MSSLVGWSTNEPFGIFWHFPYLGDGFGYVYFQPLLGDDWTL